MELVTHLRSYWSLEKLKFRWRIRGIRRFGYDDSWTEDVGNKSGGEDTRFVQEFFYSFGFKFWDKWTSVLTISDEGIYAWIVSKYTLRMLGGYPLHTTRIIELGEASTQVENSWPFALH